MQGEREGQNVLIIADKDHRRERDSILAKFPNAQLVNVKQEEKNIGINRNKLAAQLSKTETNWVFLETDDFKLITSVVSILNSFHNAPIVPENLEEKWSVRLFTTDLDNSFERDVVSSTHLSNLRFTYPSVYRPVGNDAFVRRYQKKFGEKPDRYAVRGFDLTFDVLLKLGYKKNLFEASSSVGKTEYSVPNSITNIGPSNPTRMRLLIS